MLLQLQVCPPTGRAQCLQQRVEQRRLRVARGVVLRRRVVQVRGDDNLVLVDGMG